MNGSIDARMSDGYMVEVKTARHTTEEPDAIMDPSGNILADPSSQTIPEEERTAGLNPNGN